MHHMGVDRTLFLVRKVIPNINREEVRQIVRTYDMLTSSLGLRDEQLSPPGGRGSCEEKKEEKGG